MKLIFLHGAPAVGKLTVARELATLTDARLFHNHLTVDLVSSLFPFGSEPFILLREQIWLAAFAEAARNNVSLIFTFNPERTVRERFVQDAINVVENAGGRFEMTTRIDNPDKISVRAWNGKITLLPHE